MPTFTALTTLAGRKPAYALGDAMERLTPEPTGVGVFEMEDGSPMCVANCRLSRLAGSSFMAATTQTRSRLIVSPC